MTDHVPPPGGDPESPTVSQADNGAGATQNLSDFFAMLQRDTSGKWSLLVVAVVGVLLSYILWVPFALPTELVNDVVGDKNCATTEKGTNAMRTCAASVAAWKMIGPLGIGIAVFVLRKQLAKWIAKLSTSLYPGARPLVGPILATLLFLLVWAGSHAATGGETGIVPQKAFPAIIAVYTYAVVRYGPALQRNMPAFFEKRERIPTVGRIAITVAIPTVVSLVITNQERVSATAQKEQFVVIIGLALAYLMLSPKGGDIAGAAAQRLSMSTPPQQQPPQQPPPPSARAAGSPPAQEPGAPT